MQFILGNRAIRDHQADGKQLHLFKKVNSGFYEYLGQFAYESYVIEDGFDFEHHPRKVIRFTLKKV
jgi:5-methylcytosine-specific restriction protein A